MSQHKLMNFYDVLEIKETATMEEIKKSYRKMVLKYHPDLNKNPLAVNKLQNIIKAYKILSDPEKKIEYDKNFKIFNSFPNFKDDIKAKQQKRRHEEREARAGLFSKLKIGFKIFRTKLSNSLLKMPELIIADKNLLKINPEELKERFCTSENKYVRCEALKALVVLLKKKSYSMVEKGFTDISKDVKMVSINAVGYLKVRQGIYNLEKLYMTSSSVTIRRNIIGASTRLNTERSRKIILNACQDKDFEVRIAALKAFKRLDMGEYINKISYLVYDRNEEVKKLARELYEIYKEPSL